MAVGCSRIRRPVKVEGCVSCHGLIEPMHKYGTTEMLEKLKDGKDAVGLSCTACHGGNPVATTKEQAHVQPMFPREWRRDGKYTGANPERTNTLLARESWEFVRFVNPGDLRVVAKTCGGSGVSRRRVEECCTQHDDARRDVLERRALQQRQLSLERSRALAKATASQARRRRCCKRAPRNNVARKVF